MCLEGLEGEFDAALVSDELPALVLAENGHVCEGAARALADADLLHVGAEGHHEGGDAAAGADGLPVLPAHRETLEGEAGRVRHVGALHVLGEGVHDEGDPTLLPNNIHVVNYYISFIIMNKNYDYDDYYNECE